MDLSPEAKQPLTRWKTSPYNRDVCFFSDGERGYRQPLHTVSTLSAGSSLNAAVKKEGDEKKLHVKLSTAVDSRDAHAIDIKYHKTAGLNMSQMCFVNTRPHQTSSKQVK